MNNTNLAFLAFPEQAELLISELAGRFGITRKPDNRYGDLLYFENLDFDALTDCVADNCFYIKFLHNLTAGAEFVNFPTGAGTYRWYDDDRWIDIDDDIQIFMDNWKSIFPNLRIIKGE